MGKPIDTFIMGTCRVNNLKDRINGETCPYGTVHSVNQIQQTLKIMNGELIPPDDMLECMYRTAKVRRFMPFNIDVFDKVVLEVSSIKNYYYKDYFLHFYYYNKTYKDPNISTKAVVIKDTYPQVLAGLKKIRGMFGDRKILLIPHNNAPCIPNRYILSHALNTYSREDENCKFFDPTHLIAKYGWERCVFPKSKKDYIEANHFTDFMGRRVAQEIKKIFLKWNG